MVTESDLVREWGPLALSHTETEQLPEQNQGSVSKEKGARVSVVSSSVPIAGPLRGSSGLSPGPGAVCLLVHTAESISTP